MSSVTFTWLPFYKEFAKEILSYKDNRQKLVEKYKEVFVKINASFPTIHVVEGINDIDPFTVFSHFNVNNKNEETRYAIIKGIKEVFDLKSDIPSDLNGITCSPWAYANYCVGEDEEEYRKNCELLWEFFESALAYEGLKNEKQTFINKFNDALKIKYTKAAKLSTGLLWIAPDKYFALDQYSQKAIAEVLQQADKPDENRRLALMEKLNAGKIDGADYLELKDILTAYFHTPNAEKKSFVEISYIEPALKNTKRSKKNMMLTKKQQNEFLAWLRSENNPRNKDGQAQYTGYPAAFNRGLRDLVDAGIITEEAVDILDLNCLEEMKDKFEKYPQMEKARKEENGQKLNAIRRFIEFLKWKQAKSEPKDIISQQKSETVYDRKNLILYGPPGTGKTRNSVIYAVAICDQLKVDVLKTKSQDNEKEYEEILNRYKDLKKEGRIEFVTFHQSYGYEEFIQGIKPAIVGKGDDCKVIYEVAKGIFAEFCEKAKDSKEPYVFIIDEINRGNVSKIFGELITLIEEKKRIGAKEEMRVKLPYNGEEFGVPNNVYILGTMNTADRSLVQLDAALRRRFRFIEMMPNAGLLKEKVLDENNDTGIDLERLLTAINERICELIDREHQIGHSYLIGVKSLEELRETFKYEIIPLLQEYFYEDNESIATVLNGQSILVGKTQKIDVENLDFKKIYNGDKEE